MSYDDNADDDGDDVCGDQNDDCDDGGNADAEMLTMMPLTYQGDVTITNCMYLVSKFPTWIHNLLRVTGCPAVRGCYSLLATIGSSSS